MKKSSWLSLKLGRSLVEILCLMILLPARDRARTSSYSTDPFLSFIFLAQTHVFSGLPGVGKNLTAEAVSEHMQLPF
jgi:hypothetical protein